MTMTMTMTITIIIIIIITISFLHLESYDKHLGLKLPFPPKKKTAK